MPRTSKTTVLRSLPPSRGSGLRGCRMPVHLPDPTAGPLGQGGHQEPVAVATAAQGQSRRPESGR